MFTFGMKAQYVYHIDCKPLNFARNTLSQTCKYALKTATCNVDLLNLEGVIKPRSFSNSSSDSDFY